MTSPVIQAIAVSAIAAVVITATAHNHTSVILSLVSGFKSLPSGGG
jgi:hypothetical protein